MVMMMQILRKEMQRQSRNERIIDLQQCDDASAWDLVVGMVRRNKLNPRQNGVMRGRAGVKGVGVVLYSEVGRRQAAGRGEHASRLCADGHGLCGEWMVVRLRCGRRDVRLR